MNMPEDATQREWEGILDDYLDGTLSDDERERLDALRLVDAALESEVQLARAMRREFRALSKVACPPEVTQYVMRAVRSDLIRGAGNRVLRGVGRFFEAKLRPVLAMVVLVLVVVLASRVAGPEQTADPAVAAALSDVKWTLAYLSEVSRQTGSAVRSEALEPLILNSMRQATDTFMDN